MSRGKRRKAQVLHSWGILLGLAALPVLALMAKLFPAHDTLWAVLGVLGCVAVVRSMIGFLFPAATPRKKGEAPATQAN
jgi:hypothetical protein